MTLLQALGLSKGCAELGEKEARQVVQFWVCLPFHKAGWLGPKRYRQKGSQWGVAILSEVVSVGNLPHTQILVM